jgi:hypothetical protein
MKRVQDGNVQGWAGIGTGLRVAGASQASDDEDISEQTAIEQGEEDQESGSEGEGGEENRVNVMDWKDTHRSALECLKHSTIGRMGEVRDKDNLSSVSAWDTKTSVWLPKWRRVV